MIISTINTLKEAVEQAKASREKVIIIRDNSLEDIRLINDKKEDKYEIFKKAILEEVQECRVDLDYFTNQIKNRISNGGEFCVSDRDMVDCLKSRIGVLEKIMEISKRIDLEF